MKQDELIQKIFASSSRSAKSLLGGSFHDLHALAGVKIQQQQKEITELANENKKLKAFYDYFSDLYGDGLEIANWHQNGDLEPFDSFYESAVQEMEK